RFLSGRINFCNLMPMRTIPFRVVCLLGMNEDAYPHREPTQSLDLMQHGARRRGDRSRRDEDRYLFLEAFCSARDQFYVSYVGRQEKDNSARLPSILVSELQDYCRRYVQLKDAE